MEDYTNDELIERARDIAEEYTGTPLEDAILNNLERNDLDMVRQLVVETENYEELEARREMQLGANDVY